jgi:serine/threonine protein kinase
VPIVSYPIDIWAIGVVTYELVSGFGLSPFKKMNEEELRDAILKSEP